MIILIDNYDSFSYNLYQMIGEEKPDIKVVRNDEMSISEIAGMKPEALIISPGPGRPENAGICIEAINELKGNFPILGICLGHQAICAAFGAKIGYAKELMHGKQSEIIIDNTNPIFKGCPEIIKAARYHSLSAEKDAFPDCLDITAKTKDGEIMAVKHKNYQIYGIQFHPESILTPEGKRILNNFIKITNECGGLNND